MGLVAVRGDACQAPGRPIYWIDDPNSLSPDRCRHFCLIDGPDSDRPESRGRGLRHDKLQQLSECRDSAPILPVAHWQLFI